MGHKERAQLIIAVLSNKRLYLITQCPFTPKLLLVTVGAPPSSIFFLDTGSGLNHDHAIVLNYFYGTLLNILLYWLRDIPMGGMFHPY